MNANGYISWAHTDLNCGLQPCEGFFGHGLNGPLAKFGSVAPEQSSEPLHRVACCLSVVGLSAGRASGVA